MGIPDRLSIDELRMALNKAWDWLFLKIFLIESLGLMSERCKARVKLKIPRYTRFKPGIQLVPEQFWLYSRYYFKKQQDKKSTIYLLPIQDLAPFFLVYRAIIFKPTYTLLSRQYISDPKIELEMDGETAVLVAGIKPNKVCTAKGATSASSAMLLLCNIGPWTFLFQEP